MTHRGKEHALKSCGALRKRCTGRSLAILGVTLKELAMAYGALGYYDRKLELLSEAARVLSAALGREHHETLFVQICLANALGALSKHAEERKLIEETLPLMVQVMGETHPEVRRAKLSLESLPRG